jgi:predicted amidohydrolase
MTLKVAGAQLPVVRDIAANTAAIHRAIDFAVAQGADILLTPEGSVSGYTPHFDRGAADEALREITTRAASAGLGLALGTCRIEDDGLCYNQIRFHAKDGTFLGFHAKTLRCGTMTNPSVGEINDYAEAPLRTFDFEGATVGGLICNDYWANPGCTPMPDPHLTHQLAQMGARVIFHAVNGGRDDSPLSPIHTAFHESNLLLRARADKLWVVTVDNSDPAHLPTSSPSGVVAPDGTWAVKAPRSGEQCFVFTIDWGD